MSIRFSLSSEAIDIPSLAARLDNPAAGAVVTFDGRVRNHNAGQAVSHLEYQAYPALAISTGQRILEEEAARHGLLCRASRAPHRAARHWRGRRLGRRRVRPSWRGVRRSPRHHGAAEIRAAGLEKGNLRRRHTEWVGPDNKSAETGRADEAMPEWQAELLEIWISPGNDFRGRHGQERLEHGIQSLTEVECVAGMGLRGDRYFGCKPDFKGQVTFFDAAVVQAVRDQFSQSRTLQFRLPPEPHRPRCRSCGSGSANVSGSKASSSKPARSANPVTGWTPPSPPARRNSSRPGSAAA